MTLIFYIVTDLYGSLMLVASSIMKSKEQLSLRLLLINLVGGSCLFLAPISLIFFYGGLIALLCAAILNGLSLNGRVNWRHFAVRCLFSLLLLYWHSKL
ncbi:hypothetical protein [Enterococcus sp. HY326]|uniref:hypothetical protein n=1 Tax=Enterococcus sp. HY326 TaxID=2971265 RepID=UPI00223F9B59|nr:hypothetical protein [Enterococcus sp. HY326]